MAANTTLNSKIIKVKNEMLSVTNLATYTALCAVESITYHSKYITTPEFDKLTA